MSTLEDAPNAPHTVAVVAAVVCGVALVLAASAPWSWLGWGLLVAAFRSPVRTRSANWLERAWQPIPLRFREGATHAGALLVFATLTAFLFGGPFADAPIQGDHPAHLANAWHTKRAIFEHGSLFTWTPEMFAGYPTNHLYPVGPDLWVVGWWCATFGALDFGQSYNLSLFALLSLNSWAAFALGRRLFGTRAGLVAGVLVLLDPGQGRSGGWTWSMHQGVWPNTLSMTFFLVGLERMLAFVEAPSRWRFCAVSFALAAGFVMHPMSLLFAAVLVAGLALVIAFSTNESRARWLGALAAVPTAGLLAAFWWVPFLTSRHEALDELGAWWHPASELGGRILEGSWIAGTTPLLATLGLVGAVLAWRAAEPRTRLLVGLVFIPAAVFNSSTIDAFRLSWVLSGIEGIQFLRMAIWIRPLLLVLAAFAIVEAWKTITKQSGTSASGWRQVMLSIVLGVAFGGVAQGALEKAVSTDSLRTMQRPNSWGDPGARAKLVGALNALDLEPWERIGIMWDRGRNRPLYLTPELDHGWTKMERGQPAAIFEHRVVGKSSSAQDWLNLAYIVRDREIRNRDWEEVENFGGIRVFRRKGGSTKPATVLGSGNVTVDSFEHDRVVLTGSSDAAGELVLHISEFSRWRAMRDGKELTIEPHAVRGIAQSGFMKVPFGPGETTFEFSPSAADRAGHATSFFTLLLLLLFGAGRLQRLEVLVARLPTDALVDRAPALLTAAAVASLGVGFALSFVEPPLNADDEVVTSFLNLRGAKVTQGSRQCRWIAGEVRCPAGSVSMDPQRIDAKSQLRCVTIEGTRQAEIRYEDAAIGSRLVGYHGIPYLSEPGTKYTLEVLVGGRRVYFGRSSRPARMRRFEVPTTAGVEDVTFRVNGRGDGDLQFCIAAQSVERP